MADDPLPSSSSPVPPKTPIDPVAPAPGVNGIGHAPAVPAHTREAPAPVVTPPPPGLFRRFWNGTRPPRVQQPSHTDSVREIIETVVFVVVLVLLLKSFAAEAFVIPTGSMAQTLWGYQKVVTCPDCGTEFP